MNTQMTNMTKQDRIRPNDRKRPNTTEGRPTTDQLLPTGSRQRPWLRTVYLILLYIVVYVVNCYSLIYTVNWTLRPWNRK